MQQTAWWRHQVTIVIASLIWMSITLYKNGKWNIWKKVTLYKFFAALSFTTLNYKTEHLTFIRMFLILVIWLQITSRSRISLHLFDSFSVGHFCCSDVPYLQSSMPGYSNHGLFVAIFYCAAHFACRGATLHHATWLWSGASARIYCSNIQSSSVVVSYLVIQPVVNVFTPAFYLISTQCFKTLLLGFHSV